MINGIDEILSSIKKGEMVIIMDDENRENEGDLIMASQYVKASDINFMATKGRGLNVFRATKTSIKKNLIKKDLISTKYRPRVKQSQKIYSRAKHKRLSLEE